MGPRLIPLIRNIKFNGLSGDFHLVDGQLQPSMYQIVNILDKGLKHVGYWTPTNGIKKKLHQTKESKDDLGAIIWPGDTIFSPKMGDPNQQRKQVKSRDIFIAVMDALPYAVTIEFVPFSPSGVTGTAESYKKFFHEFSNGAYDVLAGDITILADRMDTCDYSLPYTEAGFSMVVPIKVDERKSTWIFMRPLETELWITIGAFFIYTGLVVWVVEHRVNKEFRGPPRQQVGTIFWFSFSTLVFAHNCGDCVGVCGTGPDLELHSKLDINANGMGFDESKLKNYSNFEQYDKALD
ncbi:glutamate receptor 2.8-like protein [Tanacetum coccineum]